MPKNDSDFPLATYTDELAGKLRTLVPAAMNEGDVEAVHHARVTTRRLRAALNLLQPVIPDKAQKPVATALKRLRRALGDLRDADVMLGHLDELRRYPRHLAAIEFLAQHTRNRREQALADARSDAPADKILAKLGAWWGITEHITGAREAVDTLLAESLRTQLENFATATQHMNNPHAVRISGKLLRYTVEMAEVEGHKLPKNVLRSFKKIQDALGLWHDFVMLAESAMEISVEQVLAATDPALQQRVLDLVSLALRRSQSYLTKFSQIWKAQGQEISDAIRAAFPNPRAIIESKTDPDPAGSIDIPAPAADAPDRPAAF